MERVTLNVAKINAEDIADKTGLNPDDVDMVLKQIIADKESIRRRPNNPAPDGGISISKASRKYRIRRATISRWVNIGLIPVISNEGKEKYISEDFISRVARKYNKQQGRGKRHITTIISELTAVQT